MPPPKEEEEAQDEEEEESPSLMMQESACDNNEIKEDSLPEIVVPVRSKPLFVLNLIRTISLRRLWRWDPHNTTLVLHARYGLSAILAAAAMLTLVLTFIPNQVVAFL